MEYVGTSGQVAAAAAGLLYGSGSSATSLTVTPTFIHNHLFVRCDASVVGIIHPAPWEGFGHRGGNCLQVRMVLEAGLIF